MQLRAIWVFFSVLSTAAVHIKPWRLRDLLTTDRHAARLPIAGPTSIAAGLIRMVRFAVPPGICAVEEL